MRNTTRYEPYQTTKYEPINYSFSERLGGVLRLQVFVLDDIAECKPWFQIAAIITVSVFLQNLLGMAAAVMASLPLIETDLQQYYDVLLYGFATSLGLSMLLAIATVATGGFVYHLFIKIMGGERGYRETLALYGYLQLWTVIQTVLEAPFTFIKVKPAADAIVIATSLIMAAGMALAIERVHKIGRVKSVAAVALSWITVTAVMYAAARLIKQLIGENTFLKFAKTIW